MNKARVEQVGIILRYVPPVTCPVPEGHLRHHVGVIGFGREILLEAGRFSFTDECPHNTKTLLGGIRADPNLAWKAGFRPLHDRRHAFPLGIESPTMITTTQRAWENNPAARQQGPPVRAAIDQRRNLIAGTEEH